MPQPIEPPGWKRPSGYSNGMAASGRVLAVAGQVAWDAQQQIVSRDFVAQFAQALDNVIAVVRAAGGGPSDIISMTVYVTDKLRYMGSTAEVGAVWRARAGKHFPAMALVEVSGLIEPGALIEIQALAVLP